MNNSASRKILNIFFAAAAIGYFALVLAVTLGENAIRGEGGGLHLVPFVVLRKYLNGEKSLEYLLINYVGNILLFFPLGLLAPAAMKKPGFLKTLLFGFLLSVFIECLQFFLSRGYTDIDDILTNVAGAALGAVVFLYIFGGKKKKLLAYIMTFLLFIGSLYGAFIYIRQKKPQMLPDSMIVYENKIGGHNLSEYDLTAECYKMSHGQVFINNGSAEFRKEKTKKAKKDYYFGENAIFVINVYGAYHIAGADEMIKAVSDAGKMSVRLWLDENENCVMVMGEQ